MSSIFDAIEGHKDRAVALGLLGGAAPGDASALPDSVATDAAGVSAELPVSSSSSVIASADEAPGYGVEPVASAKAEPASLVAGDVPAVSGSVFALPAGSSTVSPLLTTVAIGAAPLSALAATLTAGPVASGFGPTGFSFGDHVAAPQTHLSTGGGTLPSPAPAGPATSTVPSGSSAEISFIAGITSVNTVAATSFWSWNYATNPPSYGSSSSASKWGSTTPGTTGGTVTYFFKASSNWTTTEKNALISGLSLWSAEANIHFALASSAGAADLTFVRGSDGSAVTSPPGSSTSVGSSTEGTLGNVTISIDTSAAGFGPIGAAFSTYGGYPYDTLVHEEGHMIGLGHGGPYNAGDGAGSVPSRQFGVYDSRLWSIMSYIEPEDQNAAFYGSYPVSGTKWLGNDPTTPMVLDVLAAQRLYGVATAGPLTSGGQIFGFNCNIGGTSSDSGIHRYFDFTNNTTPVVTIWDAGQNNTLDLSGYGSAETINLNPGTFSSCAGLTNNVGIAEGTAIDKAYGGSGSDTIIANNDGDTLYGGGGGDTFVAGAGADTIDGQGGTNTVSYAASTAAVIVNLTGSVGSGGFAQDDTLVNIQNVTGSGYADILTGDGNANALLGGGGDDLLKGGGGADHLDGGSGNNTASYLNSSAAVTVSLLTGTGSGGEAQGDTLVNIQNLTGSAFNDTLIGDANANGLSGGNGDDTLVGGGGADMLDGGAGNNTASYDNAPSAVIVSLASGTGTLGDATGDTLKNIQNLTGSAYGDILIGDNNANTLLGGGGADTLKGGGGADILNGGTGTNNTASYIDSSAAVNVSLASGTGTGGDAQGDTLANIQNLTGSNQSDALTGDGNANVLLGEGGNDLLKGGGGADYLDGGTGSNTASYLTSSAGVVVNLIAGTGTGGDAQGDTLVNIQDVIGSNSADTLIGDGNANVLSGEGGDDTLKGGGGADTLDGGSGNNTASYVTSSVGVVVNLATGKGTAGDAQGDTLTNIQNLTGSGQADVLVGDGNANVLSGNGGNDTVKGGGGADTLDGGAGFDTAVFTYSSQTALIILNSASSQTVADSSGTTTLANIEVIAFTDEKLLLASTAIAAGATQTDIAVTQYGALEDDGTLAISTATPLTEQGPVTGTGVLTIGAASDVTFAAAGTFTGSTTVQGRLAIRAGGSLAGTSQIALTASGAVFDVSLASAAQTIKSLSTAAGSTVHLGTVGLTVAGAATFNGSTVDGAVGGKLILNGATSIAGLSIGGGALVRNNGTVTQTGGLTLGDSSGDPAQITNAPGKTWTLAGDVGIVAGNTSVLFNNGGATLRKTSGTGSSLIGSNIGNLAGTAAAIVVATGTLQFNGASNSFLADAITGAGIFAIGGGGTNTISTGTTIATAGWSIARAGTMVTLAQDVSFGGSFSDTNQTTLDLASFTLTLTGSAAFSVGPAGSPLVAGAGKLITSGADTLSGLTLGGTVLLRNNGSVSQTGSITLGDASNGAAQATNAAGKSWTLSGDVGIAAGNAGAVFNNGGGTFAKASGTGISIEGANFTNLAGTAAAITIAAGTLNFTGTSNTFLADAIAGVGTFAIGGGGTSTIAAGTTITTSAWTIAKAATVVTLGETLSFAGSFSDTNQTTLNLGANTLTLSGAAAFNLGPAGSPIVTGAGKLITSGADTLGGLALGGTALFRNNGSVSQTGTLTLGDASNGAALITNAGTWQIAGDVGIAAGNAVASFNTGGGSLSKTAGSGTSTIAAKIVNNSATTSTITVASGTLDFAGTVTGGNAFSINAGRTLEFDAAVDTKSLVTFSGAGGTLMLTDASHFQGGIVGFASGETIDLQSIVYASPGTTSGYSGNASSGTLTVSDGSHAASLSLFGTYTPANFHLASDSHGGTAVTFA